MTQPSRPRSACSVTAGRVWPCCSWPALPIGSGCQSMASPVARRRRLHDLDAFRDDFEPDVVARAGFRSPPARLPRQFFSSRPDHSPPVETGYECQNWATRLFVLRQSGTINTESAIRTKIARRVRIAFNVQSTGSLGSNVRDDGWLSGCQYKASAIVRGSTRRAGRTTCICAAMGPGFVRHGLQCRARRHFYWPAPPSVRRPI